MEFTLVSCCVLTAPLEAWWLQLMALLPKELELMFVLGFYTSLPPKGFW